MGKGRERRGPARLPPVPAPAPPRLTCTSFSATSLKPFLSKRRTISPTSRRCTPSGFTARKVRSCSPAQAAGRRPGPSGEAAPCAPRPLVRRPPGPALTRGEEVGQDGQHQADHDGGGAAGRGLRLKGPRSPSAAVAVDVDAGAARRCPSFTPSPGSPWPCGAQPEGAPLPAPSSPPPAPRPASPHSPADKPLWSPSRNLRDHNAGLRHCFIRVHGF